MMNMVEAMQCWSGALLNFKVTERVQARAYAIEQELSPGVNICVCIFMAKICVHEMPLIMSWSVCLEPS